jgi:hypothetical protein
MPDFPITMARCGFEKFDLPAGFSADDFNVALNQIDDYDIAWVNGVKIGESFGGRNWRNYIFKANILRPKGNVLVVRVFDAGGKGGMYTNTFWGNPILTGTWKYKPGVRIDPATFRSQWYPMGAFSPIRHCCIMRISHHCSHTPSGVQYGTRANPMLRMRRSTNHCCLP